MEGSHSSDRALADLEILIVTACADGFRQVAVERPGDEAPEAFSVALVYRPLREAESALAWRCDFIAAVSEASIVSPGLPLLRRRAGDAVAWTGGRIEGRLLHENGLAALTLASPDPQKARARVLAQAETLLALKQSRAFSCPDWLGHSPES